MNRQLVTRETLKFRWEPPVEGDQWNAMDGGGTCVAVGRIDGGQVVARIFAKDRKGSTWMKDYDAWHIHHEGKGGAARMLIRADLFRLDVAQDFAADYLFGALQERIRCTSCGQLERVEYLNKDRLVALQLCHGCELWHGRLVHPRERCHAVIGGVWYTVEREPRPGTPDHCKGFGGARFEIEWLDGRRAVTTNLWRGGDVPDHLRADAPDDARFIPGEEH